MIIRKDEYNVAVLEIIKYYRSNINRIEKLLIEKLPMFDGELEAMKKIQSLLLKDYHDFINDYNLDKITPKVLEKMIKK